MEDDQSCEEFLEHSSELFDFVNEYLEDVEAGEPHDLGFYLRRFPGCEAAITEEYASLTRGATSSPLPEDSLNQRVGPYELLGEIGRGGQGVVYLAQDSRIARRVALKVLPPAAMLFSDDKRRRLQREAEVVSKLAHPGICGIYDAEMEGDVAYIAMPVIEGQTLSSLIATGPGGQASVPVCPSSSAEFSRLLSFFERAARALHAAHAEGIVHRDVKPANLMVTPAGEPVWLDFGQAREENGPGVDLTLSGEIFGTPAYMSPEQVGGDRVDVRTDLWALTVSLFEALTLCRPYEGASAHALMLSIKQDAPLDVRELNKRVGKELAVVIATGLEQDPSRRYGSALSFADDLARLQAHEPIQAQAAGNLLRLRRWGQRHPVFAVLAIAVTVSLALTIRLVVLKDEALVEKDVALTQKDAALEVALGHHLAKRSNSLLLESPATAMLLAIQAVQKAQDALTRGDLFAALDSCYLRTEYEAGHERTFLNATLIPGGKFAAGLCLDGEVLLYEQLGGELVGSWQAHGATPKGPKARGCITSSPDGRWIASGAADGTICVKEIGASGDPLSIAAFPRGVSELLFGSDDNTLLARGEGGVAALYDLAYGRIIRTELEGQSGTSGSFAFDAQSGCFYVQSSKLGDPVAMQRWDGKTGRRLMEENVPSGFFDWAQWSSRGWVWLREGALHFLGEDLLVEMAQVVDPRDLGAQVISLHLSEDGSECLVVTELEGRVRCRVLHLENGTSSDLSTHMQGAPRAVAFSHGAQRLAIMAPLGHLLMFEAGSGSLLYQGVDYLRPEFLQWSADDQFVLARQGSGAQAQLWFATSRPDVYRLDCGDSPVHQVQFSADGEQALTLTERGLLRVWSTPGQPSTGHQTGALIGTFASPEDGLRGAQFELGAGTLLAWGDCGVQRWDLDSQERLRERVLPEPVDWAESDPSSDDWLILDRAGRAWIDTGGSEPPLPIGAPGDPVLLLRFVPGGGGLLTAHASGALRLWDRASLQLQWSVSLADPEGSDGVVVDLAFDPKGERVAVAWSERRVHILSLKDGEATRDALRLFPPQSVDWSADGRRLVITGGKGRGALRVEDLEPLVPEDYWMRAEEFPEGDLSGARFNSDGKLMLSTSVDGTVMVRDVQGLLEPRSTVLLAHLHGSGGAILQARFSTGESPVRVIAGMADGTAQIWPVDPLPAAMARRPRARLREWEFAREQRFALPLEYR